MVPYMNRELRKAIYNKKMYYSKFLKDKSSKNWEQYRLRRNLVNKLKKKSENVR
jgi:S-adenosylmethionine synthetase